MRLGITILYFGIFILFIGDQIRLFYILSKRVIEYSFLYHEKFGQVIFKGMLLGSFNEGVSKGRATLTKIEVPLVDGVIERPFSAPVPMGLPAGRWSYPASTTLVRVSKEVKKGKHIRK